MCGESAEGESVRPRHDRIRIAVLAVTAVVYGVCAVGIDYARTFPQVLTMCSRSGNSNAVGHGEDPQGIDVRAEAVRVAYGEVDSEAIGLSGLRKVHSGGKVAVRHCPLA